MVSGDSIPIASDSSLAGCGSDNDAASGSKEALCNYVASSASNGKSHAKDPDLLNGMPTNE